MKRSPWRYLWTSHDIRRKLLITLLILAIYRLAAHVPVPGANREAIASIINRGGAEGTLLNILNLLSGGTVSQFSVLAMGVYPYITAQIIIQLLTPIIPSWQKRMEENPQEGQKWTEKWTYILAIPMAALQAIGQINIFSSFAGVPIISNFSLIDPATAISSWAIVIAMTAGTMFGIWLGELISEFGIRNQGLSLIIFAGIVAQIPANMFQLMTDEQTRIPVLIFLLLFMFAVIFAIVFVQQGRRNVPVMYPGRRVGRGMSMPVKANLPLMVNMAGMIPLIFAQSLLTFPAIIAGFVSGIQNATVRNIAAGVQNLFGGGSTFYWIMYFLMVVLFSFFYTDVLFAQQNYGENLKKVGAQIPGVSRGAPTQRYLTRVLRRITLPGALFLGVVAIMPFFVDLLLSAFGIPLGSRSGLLLVSSSGMLIVVGVVRDTFFNIDAELKLRGYEDAKLIR
jgi:preprotein translocase subunit SecY